MRKAKNNVQEEYSRRPLRYHLCNPLPWASSEPSQSLTYALVHLGMDMEVSSSLGSPWRLQLCAKYTVPEPASDTKAVLVVCEMVLHVVLSKSSIVARKAADR